jgi:hypothetical protein
MVRAIVGGRLFDFDKEKIEERMRGVQPETIREHVVEMLGTVYPPKQVVAALTEWPRSSFTTLEAQRVLTRAGFRCRRGGRNIEGRLAWMPVESSDVTGSPGDQSDSALERLAKLEDGLVVTQSALAELARRIGRLELLAGPQS